MPNGKGTDSTRLLGIGKQKYIDWVR
jgi:hypothetical protein